MKNANDELRNQWLFSRYGMEEEKFWMAVFGRSASFIIQVMMVFAA